MTVNVDRGRDAPMAENLLHQLRVNILVEKMARSAMSQGVPAGLWQTSLLQQLVELPESIPMSQTTTTMSGEHQVQFRPICGPVPVFMLTQPMRLECCDKVESQGVVQK